MIVDLPPPEPPRMIFVSPFMTLKLRLSRMTRSSKASTNVAKLDRGYGAVAIVYFMKSRLRSILADRGSSSVYFG